MRDWINEGAEPDDAPSGRCYGPAYPDAPGCGRFARGGMCARCQEASREYWRADNERHRAWEDAQIARERELEAAYWEAERAAHPDITCECAWCAAWVLCAWDGWAYTCKDRAACDARILGAPEYHVVGYEEPYPDPPANKGLTEAERMQGTGCRCDECMRWAREAGIVL